MSQIKAILLDAGGILFDDSLAKKKEYSFLSRYMDITYRKFMARFYPFKEKAQIEKNYSKEEAFCDYLKEIEREDLIKGFLEYNREFQENYYNNFSSLVFEGVRETLSELKEKSIDSIVLTDATIGGEKLKDFFVQAELSDYLTDIVSSKDSGMKKGFHPDFFQYALDKYNLKKEEVIFVGHDYDELKGASDFGLKVIALNYKKEDRKKLEELVDCFMEGFEGVLGII